MVSPRFRPSFRLDLSLPRDEAIKAVRTRVGQVVPANNWLGKGRWCEIHLPAADRRVWTPHLSLRLDHEPHGSSLFVRYAPRPEIWTLFVFGYAAVAFLVVLGAIFGYVQWASGEPAWGLWAVWVGIPLLVVFHLVSWIGQRLSAGQIEALADQLDRILEGLPVSGATGGAGPGENPDGPAGSVPRRRDPARG